MRKSRDYWRERMNAVEEAQHREAAGVTADIEKAFVQANREIESQISWWYQRFADNNEFKLADAKRMLGGKELAELKWGVDEYVRHGKENAINQQWIKELENASARVHISRLEALQIRNRHTIEMLAAKTSSTATQLMQDQYTNGYYRSTFELQRGTGTGWDVGRIDQETLATVLKKPWAPDGLNFSERVWSNRTALVGRLHTDLIQGLIMGRNPQELASKFAAAMDTGKHAARRLLMTEAAYFSVLSSRDAFRVAGVKEYEILETLDSKTCELCGNMDLMRVPLSEFAVGKTAPPFHPLCRGDIVPNDPDFEDNPAATRAARGEDGKTYHVPADMTFQKWKSGQENLWDVALEKSPVRGTINLDDKVVFRELTLDEFKDMKHSVTRDERSTLYGSDHFTGYVNSSNARKINNLLREGEPLTEEYQKIADTLSSVIRKNTIDDNILVTRYVADDAFKAITGIDIPEANLKTSATDFFDKYRKIPGQLSEGQVYTEKGFLSTSGVCDKNVMQNKEIELHIRVPKGTHAYITTNYKESEIIFGRDTKVRIDNIRLRHPEEMRRGLVIDCEIEE